jgi:hypothetical protein
MVYRVSWIAGIAGIGLALLRMERLLLASVEGLPWQIVVGAAALLGAALTWAGVAYRLGGRSIIALNAVGMILASFRIAVPTTTWGIFPTLESLGTMRIELDYAREVIRASVAPVLASAGLVAIAAMVFWAIGALLVWGLTRDHPYVAVLPPLIAYLQFATMDRVPGGYWPWVFLTVLGFSLLAVAHDRRRSGTGAPAADHSRRAVVRSVPSLAAVALLAALGLGALSTNALAGLVPSSGLLEWRVNSSLTGGYYGSVSYNPFVGIRQRLVSQSDVPVFVADVTGDVDPADLYWRLVTLDGFNGTQWYLGEGGEIAEPTGATDFEDAGMAFGGPTATVNQSIVILALQQDWLPAVYSPRSMTAENRTVERGFRIKIDDGSLRFESLSYRGMNYDVVSEVPQPDLDVLSRRVDGTLSPVFASREDAADAGDAAPSQLPSRRTVEDAGRFLDLPDEEPLAPVAGLAADLTSGLATDFERALALEEFFRSPGAFGYSTDIEPGHAAADLTSWLLDPSSPNYRTGYCEQFATAMGVMARQVGIPSRVVLGFAPGRLDDGRIVVRDRNAHAWVELWMPSQGWVRFDPTPRGDGINPATADQLSFPVSEYRSDQEASTPRGGSLPDLPPTPVDPGLSDLDIDPPVGIGSGGRPVPAREIAAWASAAAAALIVAGGIPALKWLRRRRRLRRLSEGDVGAAWNEIVDRLSDLGEGPAPSETPAELATAFDPAMTPLAEVYAAATYGPDPDVEEHRARVGIAARSLRETERQVPRHFSRPHRLRARYRIDTLIPSWWHRMRTARDRG